MIRSHCDYHRTRAIEEVERASSATSECARYAHLELARLHVARLDTEVGGSSDASPLDVMLLRVEVLAHKLI